MIMIIKQIYVLSEYNLNDGNYIIKLSIRKAHAYFLKMNLNGLSLVPLHCLWMQSIRNNLATDNGPEFINNILKKEIKKHKVTHYFAGVGDKNKSSRKV